MKNVLHKPTPPHDDDRWHIILQGHPEELLSAVKRIAYHEQDVIQTVEWLNDTELVICLRWIGHANAKMVKDDIMHVSDFIIIKENGRATCHGHNLST